MVQEATLEEYREITAFIEKYDGAIDNDFIESLMKQAEAMESELKAKGLL